MGKGPITLLLADKQYKMFVLRWNDCRHGWGGVMEDNNVRC